MKVFSAGLLGLVAFASAHAADPKIEAVIAHPMFSTIFTCSEHAYGELHGLGDELGSDCVVEKFVEDHGRTWLRSYKSDGRKNEDWYGWNADVLAPCAGKVVDIRENKVTNQPGIMGKPPAAWIHVGCEDGVHFMLAHIASPIVKVGDRVEAGQKMAQVGNNGMARHPHIHIGAWRDQTPLQIRFDQTKIVIE
jgi:hypothetical protein